MCKYMCPPGVQVLLLAVTHNAREKFIHWVAVQQNFAGQRLALPGFSLGQHVQKGRFACALWLAGCCA